MTASPVHPSLPRMFTQSRMWQSPLEPRELECSLHQMLRTGCSTFSNLRASRLGCKEPPCGTSMSTVARRNIHLAMALVRPSRRRRPILLYSSLECSARRALRGTSRLLPRRPRQESRSVGSIYILSGTCLILMRSHLLSLQAGPTSHGRIGSGICGPKLYFRKSRSSVLLWLPRPHCPVLLGPLPALAERALPNLSDLVAI